MSPDARRAEPAMASLPTPAQEHLLEAALVRGPRALDAWRQWEADIDWTQEIEDAAYRLLPLTWDNLLREGCDDPIMQRLKGIYRLVWYRNKIGLARLGGILRALHEAGVRTLVLKGAALVTLHYDKPGLRPMSDADVLVPIDEVERALACLMARGWKLEPSVEGLACEALVASRHAVGLMDQQGHQLDLHWHVLQENCQPGADDAFWAGAVTIDIAGVPTLALNATDQLLHVCVHGARWNELPPIRWVADAVTILRSDDAVIDWDRLMQQARQRRLLLPVQATVRYLAETFGAPIPAAVLKTFSSRAITRGERFEFSYRNSDHRRRVLGYLPILWFEYLRSRRPLASDSVIAGFAVYLKHRVGAPSIWLMPVYLFSTSPRIRRYLRTPDGPSATKRNRDTA